MITANHLSKCMHYEVEEKIRSWKDDLCLLAAKFQVNYIDIERQVRLHLPAVVDQTSSPSSIPLTMVRILENRFRNYPAFYEFYLRKSGSKELLGKATIIKNNRVYLQDDELFKIEFKEVSIVIGEQIESQLHYLRKERNDAVIRFGLFIEGYNYPFCYMSFCNVNRNYQLSTLKSALKDSTLKSEGVVQLARVYGFGDLPHGSISKLTSLTAKYFKKINVEYMITAVNPFIGFTGSSMAASGFKPFAYCQVSYLYDRNSVYFNRRSAIGIINPAKIQTPPNLLLVKGINRKSFMKVSNIKHTIDVPVELFNDIVNPMSKHLGDLRLKLEQSWSELTAYHQTPYPNDPISKGQCGVTTAYLAKEFENKGYQVLYCEGDAFFPSDIKPIKNHCWLKIPSFKVSIDEYRNVIIDLTADQNGFNESIICETDEDLRNRSIYYISVNEIEPSTIDSKGLLKRLNILKSTIGSINNNLLNDI